MALQERDYCTIFNLDCVPVDIWTVFTKDKEIRFEKY
jgi:hypothetical protein